MSQTEHVRYSNDGYEQYASRKVSWDEVCDLEEERDDDEQNASRKVSWSELCPMEKETEDDERLTDEDFIKQQAECESTLFNMKAVVADLASKQLKMLVAMHFNTLIEGSVSDMYEDIHHAVERTILSLPSSMGIADECKDVDNVVRCVLEPSFQYFQKVCNLEMTRLTAELEKTIVLGVLL